MRHLVAGVVGWRAKMDAGWLERFSGIDRLYGQGSIERRRSLVAYKPGRVTPLFLDSVRHFFQTGLYLLHAARLHDRDRITKAQPAGPIINLDDGQPRLMILDER